MIARSSLPALVVLLGALSLPPVARWGDDDDRRRDAVVTGRVVDAATALPVIGARVRLHPPLREQVTDDAGRFRFAGLSAGAYLLEVDHIAFTPRSDSLVVDDATTIALEVRISAGLVRLEPLEVNVRGRLLEQVGFYQREEAGLGTFLTRDDIERHNVSSLVDVLARLPGIRRVRDDVGRYTLHVNRAPRTIGNGFFCPIQFFVDGVAAEMSASGIDQLRPTSVEGIEIYLGPESVPAQFNRGKAACGVVVIWTRSR